MNVIPLLERLLCTKPCRKTHWIQSPAAALLLLLLLLLFRLRLGELELLGPHVSSLADGLPHAAAALEVPIPSSALPASPLIARDTYRNA